MRKILAQPLSSGNAWAVINRRVLLVPIGACTSFEAFVCVGDVVV